MPWRVESWFSSLSGVAKQLERLIIFYLKWLPVIHQENIPAAFLMIFHQAELANILVQNSRCNQFNF
jgi:hypothetical protein